MHRSKKTRLPITVDIVQVVFLFLFSALLLSGTAAFCDESKGAYGYIDKTGNIIVNPLWDDANDFSEGLAFARRNEQYFCLDSNGAVKFVLAAGISPAGVFSEGRCLVQSKGKFGFISSKGRLVIPAIYEWPTPSPFNAGTSFAQVHGKTPRVVLIDKNGHLLKKFANSRIRNFGDNVACLSQGDMSSYFDFSGKPLFNTRYHNGQAFSEGVAEVTLEDEPGVEVAKRKLTRGFIDKNGKLLFTHKHMRVNHFSCGRAQVFDAASEIFQGKPEKPIPRVPIFNGYIDKKGQIVIPAQPGHNLGKHFAEGLAVMGKDNKCGYIDEFGKFAIPTKFTCGEEFSEGLAAVHIDDRWGYINKSGEITISPAFSWAGQFHEGLAAVKIDVK